MKNILTNTLNYCLFLFLLICINSCAYLKISELERKEIKTEEDFYQYLSIEYKNFAKFELYDMHDEIDSYYFAKKALYALKEKRFYPENPKEWNLTEKNLKVLNTEFTNINKMISDKYYIQFPKLFAKILSGYDCWVEQLEENWQTKDIEECRNKYFRNLNTIKVKISDKKKYKTS